MTEFRSQNEMLLEHLKTGRAITMLEALKLFGASHTPRRILDLKQQGNEIESVWIDVMKAGGREARVKKYFLKEFAYIHNPKEPITNQEGQYELVLP